MKEYKVIAPFVEFSAGTSLELSDKQAMKRKHVLTRVHDNVFLTKASVVFKQGEFIGFGGILDLYQTQRLMDDEDIEVRSAEVDKPAHSKYDAFSEAQLDAELDFLGLLYASDDVKEYKIMLLVSNDSGELDINEHNLQYQVNSVLAEIPDEEGVEPLPVFDKK